MSFQMGALSQVISVCIVLPAALHGLDDTGIPAGLPVSAGVALHLCAVRGSLNSTESHGHLTRWSSGFQALLAAARTQPLPLAQGG